MTAGSRRTCALYRGTRLTKLWSERPSWGEGVGMYRRTKHCRGTGQACDPRAEDTFFLKPRQKFPQVAVIVITGDDLVRIGRTVLKVMHVIGGRFRGFFGVVRRGNVNISHQDVRSKNTRKVKQNAFFNQTKQDRVQFFEGILCFKATNTKTNDLVAASLCSSRRMCARDALHTSLESLDSLE